MEGRGLVPASAQPRRLDWSAFVVDARSERRENRSLRAEPQTDLVSEITGLTASIDRAAAATKVTLAECPPASGDDDPRSRLAEYKELSRQLNALRERVALAEGRNEGPMALRAELATLLFFARTLQADADRWRSAGEEREKELQRQSRRVWLRSASSLLYVETHCNRRSFGRRPEWRGKIAESAAKRCRSLRSVTASPSARWRCRVPEEDFDSRSCGS